jgi:threonyl-tRNA synthetase
MKLITLHCDYIKFKALKKALKKVDELGEKPDKGEVKKPLVVLIAVEKSDTNEKDLVKNIKDIAKQVQAENIVLYPYAHLSSDLGDPETAVKILKDAEKSLKKDKNLKVTRAPFGYYKEFELKCKGHPLAELSRSIDDKGGVHEKELTQSEKEHLWKMMTKLHMSAPKGQKGLKSNVELGRDLDLYIVSEIVGKGLPLFTPKGATIKREIERFIVDEELKRGYLHTDTPIMAKSDLYKVSGHWQHYKDSMFSMDVGGGEILALRPMTCPFQFIIYKNKPRSYKDLPIKYAEVADLFRNEQSGELRGLTRVRQFALADAHIICKPDQLEEEFAEVMDLVNYVMDTLGIKDIWYRFSKWDPKDKKDKYIQNPKAWQESEKMMKKILDKLKIKYVEAKGEAAFYGPKLDLQYKDVYGKEDTLITIQIDFALPDRYDLTYIDKDGKKKRPMVIHRSSSGATVRTMAYLLEKYQGRLPTWLAPVQVKALSFTDKNIKAVEKFAQELKEQGIRVEIDIEAAPMGGRIRDAEMQKVPYIVVIGDKEEKNKELAVRTQGKVTNIKRDKFIKDLKQEIQERK